MLSKKENVHEVWLWYNHLWDITDTWVKKEAVYSLTQATYLQQVD